MRMVRIAIGAALLTCSLSLGGSLLASDITLAQAQLLVSTAQSAETDKEVKITLRVGEKDVVFTVKRDAIGGVIARPEPGPDSKDVTITQVYIKMSINSAGTAWEPKSMVVINNNSTINGYEVRLNSDGTLMNFTSKSAGVSGNGQGTVVVGGISGVNDSNNANNTPGNRTTNTINGTTWSYPATLTWTIGSMTGPAGTSSVAISPATN